MMVNAMHAMSQGDLTYKINIPGKDEFAWMCWEYSQGRKGFSSLVKEILGSAGQLAAAAEELSAITEQSNSGVLRQQGEIDQVATAMNEMSATVSEVSNNAANAANEAQEADDSAKDGWQVVNTTIETINNLASEVERTSEVIENLKGDSISIGTVLDVIRDIAEQTNLLALNAAIEAARAGEQGRGFAVVADEVRTLASRTQQSTCEINNMIERLQNGANQAVSVMEMGRSKAEESVEQAAKAGKALQSITSVVDNIKSMNMQIASAAEEQSSTAEEINRNIVNISEVAQDTADGSQQTASASDQLAKLASSLQTQVGKFKVA
jgi:methyl-accepting chemotaxis protein